MRLTISHSTRYQFDAPVTYGLQQLRKTPKTNEHQKVLDWTTTVTGGRMELSFTDHHANRVDLVSFERGTKELAVVCSGVVEVSESHGILGKHQGYAPLWLFRRATPRTTIGEGCRALIDSVDGGEKLERLHALSAAVHGTVAYELGVSYANWTAEDALSARRGVCQDHAHVFIACAREMGFPARYVSGYLMLDDRVEQDAAHAWAEAFVDGLGWVGFDVSNGISPDTRYVRVATGLDYGEAAPVNGTRLGGDGEALSVEIEVAQQ